MPRTRTRPATVDEVDFATDRPLGMEVLTIQTLLRRERTHDLSRPMRPGFHHLILVTRGAGTHVVDFERHRLRPGMALHVGPGQVQQFGREPSLDAWMAIFKPDFVRKIPAATGVPVRPDARRGATLKALFESAARELAAYDGSDRSRALLRSLVESIALAVDTGPAPTEKDALVQTFRGALERSYPRAHEVAAYAAILRCSTRTLTRHCEQWTGKPAKRLIDERVALEARRLLAHGGASVSELAEALGFAEPTQFVKFFRRLTGETPARFRARVQGG